MIVGCCKCFVNLQMRATKTAAYYISPIEIGVLWAKVTYVKSHSKALGFLSPNREEIDLSNEVLNFDFGQGAAKISNPQVGQGIVSLIAALAPLISSLILRWQFTIVDSLL